MLVTFGGDKIRLSFKLLPAANGPNRAANPSALFQSWFLFSTINYFHTFSREGFDVVP